MCCEFAMNFFLLIIILGAAICSLGLCTSILNISCHDSERQALLSFKHGLTDPSNRLASWVEGGNCCDWYGVICHNLTGHIRELHLRNPIPSADYDMDPEDYKPSELGGKIKTSLLVLKHLHYLDLSNNDFGGIEIPKFFGSMQSLRYLNLSTAAFGGKIPYQLGNLTNLLYLDIGNLGSYVENLEWLSSLSMLRYLDLSYVSLYKAFNKLQGTIALPLLEELHLASCGLYHIPLLPHINSTNLAVLDISDNQISSPSFATTRGFGFRSLVFLDLSNNYVDGPVPSCLRNLTSLKYLNLFSCGLNSMLPTWFYQFSQLEELVLSGNSLQGIIFEDIANLTHLTHLDLSSNVIGQKVSFRNTSDRLQYLSLSNCTLSGSLLFENGQFENLKVLDLSENLISGPIPESLGSLASLEVLNLRFNQLNGTLPQSLGHLQHLEDLDLAWNIISGLIPDSIGSLTSLVQLSISKNQLSGPLPASLGQLHHLQHLHLRYNKISGWFPDFLGSLIFLINLDLSGNELHGPLSQSLGQLINLEYLDVTHNFLKCTLSDVFFTNLTKLTFLHASENSITLRVPPNWIPPFQLEDVSLSSWHLGPKFPHWLSSQNRLSYLDISNAGIKDTIPAWFWNMSSQFFYIYLSSNYFTGPLPPLLSSTVQTLDLSKNFFSGHISRFLCDGTNGTKSLSSLYIGNNQLSGEIPDCWRSLPFVTSIQLQNNKLIGDLPSSLGSLVYLQYLHLRNNNLSGVLPFLQNCTSLVALDLGENKLVGSIPKWIGQKLSKIRIPSLRWNNFEGHIPEEICALKFLIILDLAHNNLSGTIPKCFSNLNAMASFSRSKFESYGSSYDKRQILVTNEELLTPYEEREILVTKSLELEYSNNLYLMAAIDLSNNSLSGQIPEAITNLIALISLNLSRNCLTGKICENVGNMSSLESLDLSLNQLSGEIHPSMAQMTSLAFLNLSWNNLTGKIPTSTQLQSFNASSFIGNNLCGPPVSDNCTTNRSPPSKQNKNRKSHEFDEFYVSMSLGFVVGFGVVVGPLFYSKSWRIRYFLWLQSMWDKLWVWAVLFIRARFERRAY